MSQWAKMVCIPPSTLRFRQYSTPICIYITIVSPTMILPYLSALNPDQTNLPAELLTRSTKCSFALRTSPGTNRGICGIRKGPFHFPYQLQTDQRTVSPSGLVDSIHMMNLRQTRTYDMYTIDIYIYNIYIYNIYI